MAASDKGKTDFTILIIIVSIIGIISIGIGLFYDIGEVFGIGCVCVIYALFFLQFILWIM
jgi:hypothetical protein